MFSRRSLQKELLDRSDIPVADLYQNLRELDFINHWLGGYQISFKALKKVLSTNTNQILVDIGCGGGDTLKHMREWKMRHAPALSLVGIDLKPECIAYASNQVPEVRFICDDYRRLDHHLGQVDIVHACLFCHHLSTDELIGLVQFCIEHQSLLIINDLERNPIAYYAIKGLTSLFSKSYLVKNDAPLSVLRGFKKAEWKEILQQAGATNFSVKNRWAFRHEVIVYPTR